MARKSPHKQGKIDMRRGYKILLTVLIVALLVVLIGPFLVPVAPLEGLAAGRAGPRE